MEIAKNSIQCPYCNRIHDDIDYPMINRGKQKIECEACSEAFLVRSRIKNFWDTVYFSYKLDVWDDEEYQR
jgi:transposase-like protein